ncbi:unnamed protein product [Acanthoscelides obtectus]|uniref:Uncharacterized protein n=1 Tax=Acanthoscelides obtectus TaxID=200917 RepID=A0A9P0LJK1_ACAOB|nr:unnamed protein product [Acanthoscelides obtectus]CAK1657263.1 hypothetical protein AOBTE_LOCUS20256 [Acanthoscelides obtectus]
MSLVMKHLQQNEPTRNELVPSESLDALFVQLGKIDLQITNVMTIKSSKAPHKESITSSSSLNYQRAQYRSRKKPVRTEDYNVSLGRQQSREQSQVNYYPSGRVSEQEGVEKNNLQGITDHGIEVLGMKAMNTTRDTFKVVVNDQFILEEEDIIAVFANPQLEECDGKIIFQFKKDIGVKELSKKSKLSYAAVMFCWKILV